MLCFIPFWEYFFAISSEGTVGHLFFEREMISWLFLCSHGKYSCQVLVIIYQAKTCMVGLSSAQVIGTWSYSWKAHSGMVLATTRTHLQCQRLAGDGVLEIYSSVTSSLIFIK